MDEDIEPIIQENKPIQSEMVSYPSKDEIIEILKEENPIIEKGYSQVMLIFELKKIKDRIGIIKGEMYSNDMLEYRGSLLIPLNNMDANQQSHWNSIETGQSMCYGFTLDSRDMCFTEKIGDFVSRSFAEGRIQDFIPSLV